MFEFTFLILFILIIFFCWFILLKFFIIVFFIFLIFFFPFYWNSFFLLGVSPFFLCCYSNFWNNIDNSSILLEAHRDHSDNVLWFHFLVTVSCTSYRRPWLSFTRPHAPASSLTSLGPTLHQENSDSDWYCPTRQERKDKVHEELHKQELSFCYQSSCSK